MKTIKELLHWVLVIVSAVLLVWGFRYLGTKVRGPFNFFKYAMNPEYFEQHSKYIGSQFKQLRVLEINISNASEKIKSFQSYQTALADVEVFTPQVEILKVTRIASNFHTEPENYTKKITGGVIEEKGNGKKIDKYTVIAFNDGTWIKVTTGKMSGCLVGDTVKRVTSKVIKKENNYYVTEEATTYELCIN